MDFSFRFIIFIVRMTSKTNIIKSKRLRAIRILMYVDVLLLVLSLGMLDERNLAFEDNSGKYIRILILIAVFVILYVTEKKLSRYLRKHRDEM